MREEHQTPDGTEATFYAAFAATDLTAMDRVWQDGDETVCIHPGGAFLSGKSAVMQSWAEILGGSARRASITVSSAGSRPPTWRSIWWRSPSARAVTRTPSRTG